MATQDYWADSPVERNSTLFALYFPTLDSLIAPDDTVRLFADVLDEVDWSLWEAEYPRRKGQPPIHPQHIAAATLDGMYRGIRSSRKLDELFEHLMSRLNEADADGMGQGATQLPDELAEVKLRRERVKATLDQARATDEARRQQGVNPEQKPAQIPTTDPDSRVMPNKEGAATQSRKHGAPNYTPTATTDGERGFIVDCDVLSEVNEGPAALPSVDRIEETFGQRPERFLTDAGNNSGQMYTSQRRINIIVRKAKRCRLKKDREASDGDASVFVAWIGEGKNRMVVGGDGLQRDEIEPRDKETARRGQRIGDV